MADQHIEDRSGDQKYFIVTPQLVWALCQDPHEFTLWSVIKMIAGDEGECYLSTEDLAALGMMSTGKASQCRQRLIDAGLLTGAIRRDPDYPQAVWHLTIPDMWRANVEWREAHHSLKGRVALKKQQRANVQQKRRAKRAKAQAKTSLHQVKPSPDEGKPSPGEAKNNQERTTNKIVVVLTEEQETALDALQALGFQPEKTARRYAQEHDPDQVIGWCEFATANGLGAGYVRTMLDAGDPAPAPEEREPVELPEVDTLPPDPTEAEIARLGIDPEAAALWRAALGELQLQMTRGTFDTWLRGSYLLSLDDGRGVVGVRHVLAVDWLANRLDKVIRRTVARVAGREVRLEYQVIEGR